MKNHKITITKNLLIAVHLWGIDSFSLFIREDVSALLSDVFNFELWGSN